jgi:hypothetical protein
VIYGAGGDGGAVALAFAREAVARDIFSAGGFAEGRKSMLSTSKLLGKHLLSVIDRLLLSTSVRRFPGDRTQNDRMAWLSSSLSFSIVTKKRVFLLFGGRAGLEKKLQDPGFVDVRNIPTDEEVRSSMTSDRRSEWSGPWPTEYPWERGDQPLSIL